ncbi:MAG TPA: universal stress protein [Saprospiraceae bacterium]|nr:universal stress protein [Saprospiraceae bacterium]
MKNYTIRKIATPSNPPFQSNTVTAWSEHLSSLFKAQLMLYGAVEADPNPYMALYGKENNNLLKSAMVRLQDLGNSLQRAHSVKYLMESGKHWRNLVKQMRDEHTDLLVAGMPSIGDTTPGKLSVLMYNSPCPVLFVREGMPLVILKKILVPVRLKDGLEQKLPAVAAWAKAHGATVLLSAFAADTASAGEKTRLFHLVEKMVNTLQTAGIKVETETAHGFHFGTTMIHRAEQTGADLIAITVEPTNFVSRLFTKMIGPYFLENSPVPVLSVPMLQTLTAPANDAQQSPTPPVNGEQQMPVAAAMAV